VPDVIGYYGPSEHEDTKTEGERTIAVPASP
jgi:hypothetical protein